MLRDARPSGLDWTGLDAGPNPQIAVQQESKQMAVIEKWPKPSPWEAGRLLYPQYVLFYVF